MPRDPWSQYHSEIRRVLDERGYLNYSYAVKTIHGLEKMPRKEFHSNMLRIQKKIGIKLKHSMEKCDPLASNREEKAYYTEGVDVKAKIGINSGFDWIKDRERCIDLMINHMEQNHPDTYRDIEIVAAECHIPNFSPGNFKHFEANMQKRRFYSRKAGNKIEIGNFRAATRANEEGQQW